MTNISRLEETLASLPIRYPGPGGAAAVVKDGEVLARHAWGFANAEAAIPFKPSTLFRMCSITKQFTCAVLLEALRDPTVLDTAVAAKLPNLEERAPGILHLAHNQSGLRDYWAVAMLHGSPVEGHFGDREAGRVIRGTRSLQFAPGSAYSYVNQNFRLLSDILQDHTGRSFADLLRQHVFEPFDMEHAFLAADTRSMPDGTTGYEGSESSGFRAAENNVLWTGDAGLGASLDDMIAWEKAIDRDRHNPDGLYNRLSAPVAFSNGSPARYGFGLARTTPFGLVATGHGGALRGWRSNRIHIASERLSVIVLFNHMSNTLNAVHDLVAATLDLPIEVPPHPGKVDSRLPGLYFERETGLALQVDASEGSMRLRYAYGAEYLDTVSPTHAGTDGTRIALDGDRLTVTRPLENRVTTLVKREKTIGKLDIAGEYLCGELDAALHIVNAGGTLYATFSGMLGAGRMEQLQPLSDDLWQLPCLRALDHAPPGQWTLAFTRGDQGDIRGVSVGCWLARNLFYERAHP
ncbi:D-aminopeptidase [Brytella acorum]|uniref:D-aminopeptidase n=1 Tax=Brytella acorum TaxID=2959299 RepID=A0AA35UP31_9PROT|nr:D-aminopeptidase [Brytella acorum]MDF3625108.1 D-aminopeptidase [Brytella acorum]CAI9121013.1 D-aminopeptidase [Brytella acorum]